MKKPYILRSSRPTQNTFSFSPLYSNAAIKCIKIKLTFNATRYYTGAPASQCKINACTFCPVKLKREKRRVHLNTHHTKHFKKKKFHSWFRTPLLCLPIVCCYNKNIIFGVNAHSKTFTKLLRLQSALNFSIHCFYRGLSFMPFQSFSGFVCCIPLVCVALYHPLLLFCFPQFLCFSLVPSKLCSF